MFVPARLRGSSRARCAFALCSVLAANAGAQAPLFSAAPAYSPSCLAGLKAGPGGDFDGDGKLDVVCTGVAGYAVVRSASDVAGATCTSGPLVGILAPWLLQTTSGHFNADAHLDLLVTAPYDGKCVVFAGDGQGAFSATSSGPYPSFPPVGAPYGAAVGDVNADGLDDAVVMTASTTMPTTGAVRVLLNQGGGVFTAVAAFAAGDAPGAGSAPMFVRDINGDGHADVAFVAQFNGSAPRGDLRVAYGDGAGGFTLSPWSTASVVGARFIDVSDLDADGYADCIFVGQGGFINVIYGQAGVGIGVVSTYYTGYFSVWDVKAGDWDEDGTADLCAVVRIANSTLETVRILRGSGGRAFAPIGVVVEPTAALAFGARKIYVEDRDGDGDDDMLLHRTSDNFVPAYAPRIDRFVNETVYARPCLGTSGSPPAVTVGTARVGNAEFFVGLSQALPFATTYLGLSLLPSDPVPVACGVAIDLTALLLDPLGAGAFAAAADGTVTVSLPIPPNSSLTGLAVYTQWFVVDPGGEFQAAGFGFSASPARRVVID